MFAACACQCLGSYGNVDFGLSELARLALVLQKKINSREVCTKLYPQPGLETQMVFATL
jgi:hypothetical protein